MESLLFRAATLDDLPLLRRWDEQPHLASVLGAESWGWEEDLAHDPPWRDQLIAELDGRPAGFLQLMDPAREPTGYWGPVGSGHRAIDIWIGEPDESNLAAHRFYRRFGFTALGKRVFGADPCLVFELSREAWEAADGHP